MNGHLTGLVLVVGIAVAHRAPGSSAQDAILRQRAVLPAPTFAIGPTSGRHIAGPTAGGIAVPFEDRQPVQGFSAVADLGDGTYLAMSDNGFGSIQNSADHVLRVHHIRPDFESSTGGTGRIETLSFLELRDPDRRVPFAIVNEFTDERILTGADFDLESMVRAADGTLWFGDEFGPFLLHADATGRLLAAPIPLPDLDAADLDVPARELRAPQNPFTEEGSTLRVLNAMRADARAHGNTREIVCSPWHLMLADGSAATFVASREAPPAGSGLVAASSEIHDVALLRSAGFPVVPYTVNDPARMAELLDLGVDGIISDRPDLLYQAIADHGRSGELLLPDGRIDGSRIDAQGHRGGRDLRPENTLPALEVALDHVMTTLEFDCGVTKDGQAVLNHDPVVSSLTTRRADGRRYEALDEVLIRDLTLQEIQETFVADKVFRGPQQRNDLDLSPVAVAYAERVGMHPYALPSLEQVFEFVAFYVDHHTTGPGRTHPQAVVRARNAAEVRFNVETKIDPLERSAARTLGPEAFVRAVAGRIAEAGLERRADVQSFDWRTLRATHREHPAIRTVCLLGDFPLFDDPTIPGSADGTNLQTEKGANTPWLAGLFWPYRQTVAQNPLRVRTSGGLEGLAASVDGTKLYPLLEQPLVDGTPGVLLIHEFDVATREWTGVRWEYTLDPKGSAIGDFVLFSANRGLVIERDGSQGDLAGFKRIFEIELPAGGGAVEKIRSIDLLDIADPDGISLPGEPGDVGTGATFALPFVTIESVFVVDASTIGVVNDNNFPFSVGRHVGSGAPDDTEMVILELVRPLGR
jgi:glycerophosphoryl diester phosphodiesterase